MDFSLDDVTRLYILKRMTADLNGSAMLPTPTTTTTTTTTANDDDEDEHGAQFFFQNLVRVDAVDFGKKSSKSELSLRFFGHLGILQDLEGHHETCEVPIWRSCEFLSVTSRFVSKNYPRHSEIQLSMIFGGGVNKSISIFFLTFGQN